MGGAVCRLIEASTDMELSAAIERETHPELGRQYGNCRLACSLPTALETSDVVVDFALPPRLADRVGACAGSGKPYVCGVTGLDDGANLALGEAARRIPVVYAPNFSVGIALLYRLAADAARALGAGYDAEIVEAHHRHKKDAPSGTALKLSQAVREARAGDVPIHAIRAGDITGDHTVVFAGPGERLELTHRASSRDAFAHGVLAAVRFACEATPGLYSMSDVPAGRP